jgi:hypothetical protein
MAEIEKIKPRSFQLSETNMELLEQVNKELGAATWNEVFTNLLQRFYDPIKVNDKNSEEIKSLRASNEDLRANLRDKIQHEKDLQHDLDEMIKKFQDLSSEMEAEKSLSSQKVKLSGNQVVFEIDKINMLVLREVAKREGERRDQNWSPSDVVNYFIESRFIKGDLNGNLKSLPDSVVDKLRKECE